MPTPLGSKKLIVIVYGITGILIVCLLSKLDSSGVNSGTYATAVMAIAGIAGVHNWAQGRIDEKKKED